MYEKIFQLPLFQGINSQKFEKLIEITKFSFLKFPQYSTIAQKGHPYNSIKFILSGKIRTEFFTNGDKIRITQDIRAPHVISPHFLFGYKCNHPHNIYAIEDTSVMEIDKPTLISMMQSNDIFMVNMLNMTSYPSQKASYNSLFLNEGGIIEKFALWIQNSTCKNAENINIYCRQKDLYILFGVQRSSFISAMAFLKECKVINIEQNKITILDRNTLINDLMEEETIPDEHEITQQDS